MNLFKSFKDKKKPEYDIIASVEEEDILYEEQALAQSQAKVEEPVIASAPVEEPVVEQPVEEPQEPETVEEPIEEVNEEPVEEAIEEPIEEPVEEQPEEPAEEVVEESIEETVEEEPIEEPVEEQPEEPVEEAIEEPIEEPAEEVVEEPAEEVVEEPIEEVVEEPVEEVVEETAEEPAEEVAEEVAQSVEEAVDIEPIVIPDIETPQEEVVPKEPVYQPTFAEKMNIADEDIQRRYDELKNYALRFKKLTWRISKKYDSINQGRFQFVKLSVAGKTLKLNLNMDISECDPKYHCVDKRDTKTYEEVPTQMRIKSDRGLKYARELIDQCAQKHGLIENPKFKPVDSLELIRQHLELGNTDDIIIETQFDDED